MKSILALKISLLALLLIALLAPFSFFKPEYKPAVKTVAVKQVAKKPAPVVEKPLHSVLLPDFAAIVDIKEKKGQFFDFIRPAVVQENGKILQEREAVLLMLDKTSLEEPLSDPEIALLTQLVKKYRVSKKYSLLQKLNELLTRVDIIPTPLVLVQAANESAWGTSRFARIGLNFFGIWCYRQGCGMVPKGRDEGASHEVAAFDSVDAAVAHYLYNINTNSAYTVFRAIRAQLRAQNQPLRAQVLATGLLPYSERGTDYVLEITQMIRHNQDYLTSAD